MITIQSNSKNGTALVKYLLDEESHREGVDRNLYTTTVNLMPSKNDDPIDYIRQFKSDWNRAIDRHKVQMRHMILSASRKEWMSDDENEAAFEFGELVTEYIKEYYPNRRAIIAVQSDGSGYFLDSNNEIIRSKSGRPVRSELKAKKISGEEKVREEHVLHAHVALSDCDMIDAKGVETEKTGFAFLSKTFDDFFVEKTGIEIDHGVKRGRAKYLAGKLQEESVGTYISYKDDLADRIDQCIGMSSDMDSFYLNLPRFGVKLKARNDGTVFRDSKKYGRYVTFELVDQSRTVEGERYKSDMIVNGELKKAGTLVKAALRSYNFDSNGYDLESIANRISNHEVYVPVRKENIEVSVHDLYMSKMRGLDETEYLSEINTENDNYFAAMKAKVEAEDKIRQEQRERVEEEAPEVSSEERWAQIEATRNYWKRVKEERAKKNTEEVKNNDSQYIEDEQIIISEDDQNNNSEMIENALQKGELQEKLFKNLREKKELDFTPFGKHMLE